MTIWYFCEFCGLTSIFPVLVWWVRKNLATLLQIDHYRKKHFIIRHHKDIAFQIRGLPLFIERYSHKLRLFIRGPVFQRKKIPPTFLMKILGVPKTIHNDSLSLSISVSVYLRGCQFILVTIYQNRGKRTKWSQNYQTAVICMLYSKWP
jgi:hypothetical protein